MNSRCEFEIVNLNVNVIKCNPRVESSISVPKGNLAH